MVANVAKVMDNLQICAARAPQIAVSRAIEPLQSWRDDNRKEIARRAEALRVSMSNVAGWHVEAVGAYFAFVRHPYDGLSSVAVAEKLAKTTGIITLPGSFFGESQDAFLRFAFANVDVAGIEATAARLSCFKM
jgi:aspartate/methionine/tyrosine aminotransferase